MKSSTKEKGSSKLAFELLPVEFEERIVETLMFGNTKYEANSWRSAATVDEYYAALRRHLNAWRKGEKIDKESGLSHLAHAATNIMFIMYLEEGKTWRT